MKNLDNPKIESDRHHPFNITIPNEMPSNDLEAIAFYERYQINDPSIDTINVEKVFSKSVNINYEKVNDIYDDVQNEVYNKVYNEIYSDSHEHNEEVKENKIVEEDISKDHHNEEEEEIHILEEKREDYNDYDDESDEEDKEDEVTIENIENLAPFVDISVCHTYITRVNKDHRLIQSQTNDPLKITFVCTAKGCLYQAIFIHKDDGYHFEYATSHTCKNKSKIEKTQLYNAVKKHDEQEHISVDYMNQICKDLNLPYGSIAYQRIRNAHNKVFGLNRKERLKTWGMLESFLSIIRKQGGYSSIHKNDKGNIDFVGFVPDYSVKFMNSNLFFPVVEFDTRFQTGISGGHLYCMITMTGNRSILPISAAWAPSESKQYTDMLLEMLNKEQSKIQTCQTDDSNALISSIEKVGIFNTLCIWHMSKHCPDKAMFKALVAASDSRQYALIKDKVQKKYINLNKYLTKNNRWSKITRFEGPPRDQNIATSGVESLNSLIARLHFKNKEPLQVFKLIYEFGFVALQKICYQTGYVTQSVHDYLTYSLNVAHKLKVSKSKLSWGKYDVTKLNDPDTFCTVFIFPNKKPSCTCLFYRDCGMICSHILAVACQNGINWFSWIHPRYIPQNYRNKFQDMIYPDFNQVIRTNKDLPEGIKPLKQRNKRIPTPGDAKKQK